jgi:hypothetical protein
MIRQYWPEEEELRPAKHHARCGQAGGGVHGTTTQGHDGSEQEHVEGKTRSADSTVF